MLRGYLLQRATSFIEHHFAVEHASRIKADLPGPVQEALRSLKPSEWYPREHCIVLHHAIASAVKPEGAYEALVACGAFMAAEATSTYLQFVMRLLTPALFCRKVPSFWKRDHSEGEFAVENVQEGRIDMRLSGVAGFDHVGAVSTGFLRFGMKAVGASAQIEQTGWSLSNPGPAEVHYKITWT
jgi:hypothetical protein